MNPSSTSARPWLSVLASRPGLRLVIKAAFSVALVWFVIQHVNFHDIVERLGKADTPWLFAALASAILSVVLQAARWRMLTLALLSMRQALAYTWIGIFYGAILPGGVSGDIAKGAAIALKDTAARSAVLPLSIVADRLAGLYALSVLFLVSGGTVLLGGAPSDAGLIRVVTVGLIVTSGFVALATGLISPAGQRLLAAIATQSGNSLPTRVAARLAGVVGQYAQTPGIWLRVLPLSFLNHAVNILTNSFLLLALGGTLTWSQWIVFYSLISALLMVPVSISGLGVRDWFALFFFPTAGVLAEVGVAYSWLSLGLGLTIALIGGVIQLLEVFRPHRPDAAG